MAFAENHGTRIFDRILLSEGLAHIADKIFDQLDGETFANCELVCKLWRQFIMDNGLKVWKRLYLQKLAKPGTQSHGLIKSNPTLFQLNQEKGIYIFYTFLPASSKSSKGLLFTLLFFLFLLLLFLIAISQIKAF
jgi:hypothetical protein